MQSLSCLTPLYQPSHVLPTAGTMNRHPNDRNPLEPGNDDVYLIKMNTEPKNGKMDTFLEVWEDDFPFQLGDSWVPAVNFPRCILHGTYFQAPCSAIGCLEDV